MITRQQIINDIIRSGSCATWDYQGKGCGVDPIDDTYVMWYGYGIQDDSQRKSTF